MYLEIVINVQCINSLAVNLKGLNDYTCMEKYLLKPRANYIFSQQHDNSNMSYLPFDSWWIDTLYNNNNFQIHFKIQFIIFLNREITLGNVFGNCYYCTMYQFISCQKGDNSYWNYHVVRKICSSHVASKGIFPCMYNHSILTSHDFVRLSFLT
jgi:hypothetical protein